MKEKHQPHLCGQGKEKTHIGKVTAISKGGNRRMPPVDVQLLFLNGTNGSILKYLKCLHCCHKKLKENKNKLSKKKLREIIRNFIL
jgi:hypothetical protein